MLLKIRTVEDQPAGLHPESVDLHVYLNDTDALREIADFLDESSVDIISDRVIGRYTVRGEFGTLDIERED